MTSTFVNLSFRYIRHSDKELGKNHRINADKSVRHR